MTDFLPWSVLHLSLQERLPDLEAEPGVGGLFVVFWSHGRPLGQLSLPAALLPVGSVQLTATVPSIIAPAVGHRALTKGFEPPLPVPLERQPRHAPPDLGELLALRRPLDSLAESAARRESIGPLASVSVVICTRNRPDYLGRCLASIRELSPRPNEILVVDNDPGSGVTRPLVDRFPEVDYLPEPREGLSAARNAGVLRTTGEIVAFTDDDVIVTPGWVGAIRDAFDEGKVMALTGLVLPAELKTLAQHSFQSDALGWGWGYRAVDFDDSFFDTTRHLGVPVWRLGAGANMAFRRDVFNHVGLFDERLGAGASGCSEDSELWYRLLAEGHRCRYAPTAVVFHHHRPDWNGLRQQMYSYMRGHVTALFVQFERYHHWGNVYRALVALPWYLSKLGLHSIKRRAGRALYGSGAKAQAQPVAPQIMGALAGYGYYLRHRRRRSGTTTPRPRPAVMSTRSESRS